MESKRYYIKEGALEPIHLVENERKLLAEGMQTSVAKILQEVQKSMKICKETCGEVNNALIEKNERIQEFYDKFSTVLRDKPYILQKCSLHGIVLVKEIISKAREEANLECQ